MTTPRHLQVGMMLGLACLWCSATVTAMPNQSASKPVRAINSTIAMLIQQASERSRTFRGLLDTINASDGIVFIEPGECSNGRHGCFVNVTMAGPTRLLWVKVRLRGNDCDVMSLIAHELQHTIEVLGDPHVTSFSEMYYFYSRVADEKIPVFETFAAEITEATVRAELKEKGGCIKIR